MYKAKEIQKNKSFVVILGKNIPVQLVAALGFLDMVVFPRTCGMKWTIQGVH